MKYLDSNPNVLEWNSEEIVVPYLSPLDNRWHRYFVDFAVVTRSRDGSIKTMLVEIKPKAQTIEPKVQSKRTRRYITEVVTFAVNQKKWEAATEYCAERGWEFKVLTEDDIGLKK